MASQVLLVCAIDSTHQKSVPSSTVVNGMTVVDWWDSVGRRCSACRHKVKVHAKGHDTEYEAARAAGFTAASVRALVLRTLEQYPDGLTDDEGADLIGGDRLRFGRRRNELADAGLVVDSGRRRQTPAGRNAIVWKRA